MDIKQYIAILHLATGANNKDAAVAAGVSLSSLDKWKQNKEFQVMLNEAIQRIYLAGIAELAKSSLEAAKELRRIATDVDASDRVKISAITVLFGQLEKVRGWDLEQRISRLEEILENGTERIQDQTD
ncbi:hypothetical protein HW132_34570 [Brasilonema sp. CT11]|nr:hypothetical protein [Brasilonema sp. CT11]